ncbi:CBM35 domain-containing protein [Streptomyces sp. NPDC051940]|uniref:CBM35 domain-containing protein n=1 Tax=Streptomyces sp. NPDC051940 TaxID=3155675 RepID=UPI00341497C6
MALRRLTAALAALATVAATAVTVLVTAAAPPALALENGLARTPPMGFNNWNTTHCTGTFNEEMIKGVADTFVAQGLKDVGYQYVNIDDCWALPSRDSAGDLVPDPVRFPNGIKAVADYVHARGLKFGIYTSAGTKTCNTNGFPGALGHEQQDAALFASWGVDYLKYDNCNNQGVDAQSRYTAMRDALAATGRPIVYSICEWGQNKPWLWAQGVGNLWRTTGDISDNWTSMIGKAHTNDDLAPYAGPGNWNDPDMLEVGNGGMTATEYRTHFSLWAMMAAPLLIGSDIRSASATTLSILKNTDVIALDQDPLGRQATIVSSAGGLVVYSKPLANGDRAVALLNETSATATVSTSASAAGLGGSSSYRLTDLWTKAVSTTTGSISASVPAHGTTVFRLARADRAPVDWYQAEDGLVSDGAVESNHAGYTGSGFVNTANAAGPYVEWTVPAAQPGNATLGIRYANGTTADRPLDVRVNGTVVASGVSFNGTGAWSTWQTATLTAALQAGDNTVRVTATSAGGAPNLDRLDVQPGDPPPPVTTYQAEGASLAGAARVASCAECAGGQKAGWIGNGAANTVTFGAVSAASGGSHQLTIAALVNGTRSFTVTVNGGAPQTVSFTGTSFATPITRAVTVTLNAGTNTIRFGNDTAYAPDLDQITVT